MRNDKSGGNAKGQYLRRGIMAILVICTLSSPLAAEDKTRAAAAAAQSWLQLVDNEHYARSWQAAAALFQTAVDKTMWHNALSAGRRPLGSVLARQTISAKRHQTLPGAPDGEYVVIQYQSRFSKKASAVETLTMMLEKDGKWRTSGYFIR